MNAATLRELLRAQPFVPFELILSSADRYTVVHPEMMLLLKDRVQLAQPPFDPDEGLPTRTMTISFLHIAAANPLETSNRG